MSVLFLQMEINFILFLQGLGNWLLPIMNFFTFLGSEYVYLLLLPLLYWCIDSAMGVRTALMLVFSVHTNTLLKMAFHTPRPYWVDSQVKLFRRNLFRIAFRAFHECGKHLGYGGARLQTWLVHCFNDLCHVYDWAFTRLSGCAFCPGCACRLGARRTSPVGSFMAG